MSAEDLAPSDAPTAWAMEGWAPRHVREANPGKLFPSCPFYTTEEGVRDAARMIEERTGGSPINILFRVDGGPWNRADEGQEIAA